MCIVRSVLEGFGAFYLCCVVILLFFSRLTSQDIRTGRVGEMFPDSSGRKKILQQKCGDMLVHLIYDVNAFDAAEEEHLMNE